MTKQPTLLGRRITRVFAILLSIGFVWGQGTDSLIVDKSFYDNGKLKYQRFYKDGKANGKWAHYYDDGNTWIEGNYNNGIKVGLWTTYYKNGQEWTMSDYKNNERSGKWLFYNDDGTVYEEKEY